MKDHTKYYNYIKNIPTLDLGDINEKVLVSQRNNFYSKLCITKADMEGKEVLELCPGTGYNSYFLLKYFNVRNVTCIDFNKASIEKCKKNLSNFNNVKILKRDLNLYTTKKKYDYVILENALDAFVDADKIFRKVQKFLKKDGSLILMYGNKPGIFSMKLRYLISIIYTQKLKITKFQSRLKFLSKLFKGHLNYLSSNSRNSKKWVLDNILNEDWISNHDFFDFSNLKKNLLKNYYIKSYHPKIIYDFSWYKNINQNPNEEYFKFCENSFLEFLDFETKFNSVDKKASKYIISIIKTIKFFHFDKPLNINKLKLIKNDLKKLKQSLNLLKKDNKISKALDEVILFIDQYNNENDFNLNFKYFKKFWGSYNQMISIYKK